MEFEGIARISLLYDFYGQLLTKRQKEVMELYHGENLSLSEIAEEFSISRQGVHDSLKSAEKSLVEYENKLGLVARFQKTRQAIEKIDRAIDEMMEDNTENSGLIRRLGAVKTIIDKLDQWEEPNGI